MLKILAPLDGSNNATRVLDHVIALAKETREVEVHVINVRETIDAPQVQRFWTAEHIAEFQHKEGNLLLAPARERLTQAGITHCAEVLIGDIAPTIAAYAKTKGCDLIVMGTRGMGSIANLLLGSVATKVIHLAEMPVQLVK